MRMLFSAACLLCLTGASVVPAAAAARSAQPVEPRNAMQPSAVVVPPMPDRMSFAGEQVPLQCFDVRESLEREVITNSYLHSSTLQALKRATRYFPVIEPILRSYGVPDDFKYLCVAESNLSQAVSSAGAVGFWQFMKSTAVEYGLEVNEEVDERYHVERATEAACLYLQHAREEFGNWTMAAASYNMGLNGARRQAERQRTRNYYDLLLNDETARYVYRILALKLILEHPAQYGFVLPQSARYAPLATRVVEVTAGVDDLVTFAANYGISYKTLKTFNPWLRDTRLSNKRGRTYRIRIPADGLRPALDTMQ